MDPSHRPYDIVVFGASGFTGQYVVEHLALAVQRESGTTHLSWAVSGRTEAKLRAVLDTASQATGLDLRSVPLILSDVSDEESLSSMARQTRLVLNCVGPYRFYGEQVVRACVEAGAHHLDISGEPAFLERMQLEYDGAAKNKRVYVVGACGFDSIPSDLGQMFLTKEMAGDVNDIETYLQVTTPENVPGATINFGTWQSLIYGISHAAELRPIRRKLYPERLPPTKPKLAPRSSVHFSELVNSWCVPFPGSDRSVMMRTQRFRHHVDGLRPTQIACYYQLSSLFYTFLLMFVGAIVGFMANYSWGRKLLEDYPGFFSFGAVSKQGPSKAMADETNFHMTLVGRGWKTQAAEHDTPMEKEVTVTVSGKNVGYGATCQLLVQAALVVLMEADRMPGQGGVLTPGYAFAGTTLVERLNNNGVPFTSKIKEL